MEENEKAKREAEEVEEAARREAEDREREGESSHQNKNIEIISQQIANMVFRQIY